MRCKVCGDNVAYALQGDMCDSCDRDLAIEDCERETLQVRQENSRLKAIIADLETENGRRSWAARRKAEASRDNLRDQVEQLKAALDSAKREIAEGRSGSSEEVDRITKERDNLHMRLAQVQSLAQAEIGRLARQATSAVMSPRFQAALAAMQGILASDPDIQPGKAAGWSVSVADALLVALEVDDE